MLVAAEGTPGSLLKEGLQGYELRSVSRLSHNCNAFQDCQDLNVLLIVCKAYDTMNTIGRASADLCNNLGVLPGTGVVEQGRL